MLLKFKICNNLIEVTFSKLYKAKVLFVNMQSLESLGKNLTIGPDKLEATMPGAFVNYHPVRMMSAQVSLATAEGVIKKEKKRAPEKAIYEFLSLRVWNKLMEEYSRANELSFRAPLPVGLTNLDSGNPVVFMEFLNGYEIKKLNTLKRNTPVYIKGQKLPLPLYAACALHLGALNRIKEEENLFHSDYDSRHIIFSPVRNVSISVVDVENSRKDEPDLIKQESRKIFSQFQKYTSSPRDLVALASWYEQGYNDLIIPDRTKKLDKVLFEVQKEYDIELDFLNMVLNGVHLRSHA